MKKFLLLLLVAAIFLSSVACGGETTVNCENADDHETIKKYEDILDLLEKEDYGGAIDEINKLQTQTTTTATSDDSAAAVQTVELTAENWDTYFEMIEVPYFTENKFGETDTLYIAHFYVLKDGVGQADEEQSSVLIEYTYKWGSKSCAIDFVNKTFTLGEYLNGYPKENSKIDDRFAFITDHSVNRFGMEAGWVAAGCGTKGTDIRYDTDFQVLRVQGTLYLKEE